MAVPAYAKVRTQTEAKGKTLKMAAPEGAAKEQALLLFVLVEKAGLTITIAGGGWNKLAGGTGPQSIETWAVFELPNWNGTTTEYTIEWGGEELNRRATFASISGADLKKAVSVVGTVKNAEAKEAEVLGLTTITKENLLVFFQANGNGFTATPPANWTERADLAGGPQFVTKNAGVEIGAQGAVKTTLNNSAEYTTIMLAIQPPQPAGEKYEKTLEETVTISDALTRKAGKALAESVTISDALTQKAAFKRTLEETVTISDAVAKKFGKPLAESVTISDALQKKYGLLLKETVTISDEVAAALGIPGGIYVRDGGVWKLAAYRVF